MYYKTWATPVAGEHIYENTEFLVLYDFALFNINNVRDMYKAKVHIMAIFEHLYWIYWT